MTNREFLNAVIGANLSEEMTQFATDAIAKMDKRNADRSSKPSKTAIANEPVKAAILTYIADHPKSLAADVATGVAITPAKASGLCVQLVKEGKVTSEDVKIPKKGKVKAYTIV